MRNLLQDIRYGVRMLFKQPGFSLAAVLVLSLGIGGSTAMFSIVDALLLKPLLIQKADQIVGCFSRDTQKPDSYRAFSYPNYADLRADNGVFSSLAAHNLALVGLKEGDSTRRVFSDIVTANYFDTLGVPLVSRPNLHSRRRKTRQSNSQPDRQLFQLEKNRRRSRFARQDAADQWAHFYDRRNHRERVHGNQRDDQPRAVPADGDVRIDGQRFRRARPAARVAR